MHISEGVLGAPVLLAGAAAAATGVAVGLRKMDYEKLPQVAVFASVFFLATLIHVPVGPAAAHLVLNGLCGLLLGWAAFPAILVGLTLQALLFQFGGLTTLGLNTFNMAFPAVLVWLVFGRFIQSPNALIRRAAEFAAGAAAIFLSGVLVAASLVATGEAFSTAARLIVVAHVPVMLVEGIITVFVVEFVKQLRPEMLGSYSAAARR
jgi:cobalt/nickel transport system permease protein